MLTPFFDIFLHLSAPLVLVIFYNPSLRKLVFHRSHCINFNTFSACFFDFISSVIFYKIFLTFGGHLGFHLASFVRKKHFRKYLQKKEPPTWKRVAIDMSGGSQRGRLACALLKQETTVRAQNVVRICFHRFVSPKNRKCCLNWLPLQMFQRNVRRNVMSRAHCWWSDTPLAKGLAN